MYFSAPVLTGGVLRLLQLVLNPFITAGLQSAAYPNNGLPYAPGTAPAVAVALPPRQLGSDLLAPLSPSSFPGSMTVGTMQPVQPFAPWLFSRPLPAVPASPTGPVFVPPSAVPLLLQEQAPQAPGSLAGGALAVLQQAIAPYIRGNESSSAAADDTASPMPMQTLLSVLSGVSSGAKMVFANFMASFVVMGAVRLVRLVVQNLPIVLNVLGLTRASMTRAVVEGVTRAQCLQRAACVLGRHAATYKSTSEVLRWLRSPNPVAPEHPVWGAFRSAAEGATVQCEAFAC